MWEGWEVSGKVNGFRFLPGDSVFFRGGGQFLGTLHLGGRGLFVGSYGKERATIDGGDSSAIILYKCVGCRVRGLRLVGLGRKSGNVRDGLAILECTRCQADDIDITGFQKSGLFIWSCMDIVVSRIVAYENGAAGIA